MTLRVHNTQPNNLHALLIQLQKTQYFEIAEDLQKGHPLPTVLIVPRNWAFTHKAFTFHKVDQLANEITLLGLVVDISMGWKALEENTILLLPDLPHINKAIQVTMRYQF